MKKKAKTKNAKDELELFLMVFDSFVNGAIITDADGYISHFNKPYGDFLKKDPEELIGRLVTDVIENTRMHIVGKTGLPELNQTQEINGQNIMVHRIPLKKNGKVIAVFGMVMFQDLNELAKLAEKAVMLETKIQFYEQELRLYRSTRYTFDSIIGGSKDISLLKEEALKATANSFPVLIFGESGTGKELFAQAIHHGSARGIYPFIRINCAAIPKDLLESELFGYEKGAFTGASTKGKPGKFELAHRGTMFLDEVGDLPMEMQPKLLRVLEEREFERVGGNKILRSDFRLIAATNKDLEEMVDKGLFRKDLFYRMNVIQIPIPPLRSRREDIIPMAEHMLDQLSNELMYKHVKMSPEVVKALKWFHWPGNARELFNVLERALTSMEGDTLNLNDLPFNLTRSKLPANPEKKTFLKNVLAKAEKEAIEYVLQQTGNNKAKAAEQLGIHRTLLYKKMAKYHISLDLK